MKLNKDQRNAMARIAGNVGTMLIAALLVSAALRLHPLTIPMYIVGIIVAVVCYALAIWFNKYVA